jgi:hypothetical protein
VSSASMTTQPDPLNQRTIAGADNTEVHAYFGCWLDINDSVPRYPLQPPDDGPFTELWPGYLHSVQTLMRGLHQCLVAELHYTLDPILSNATPGTSDNLAQRNILLDETDNPGGFGTHLVHHTFELKPTAFTAGAPLPTITLAQSPGAPQHDHGQPGHDEPGHEHAAPTHDLEHAASAGRPAIAAVPPPNGPREAGPDYLMIHWGNLPRNTHASFYFPSVDTAALLRYESQRNGPGNLTRGEDHTVNLKVTDVGFVTIPASPRGIPALVTLQLPPGVAAGQRFRIVMQQVQRRTHKIIGTFEFRVAVSTAPVIVPELRRNFSVLKHIGSTIPATNRWFPIWQRYLDQMGARLRAFGEDPEEIRPSSTGNGKDDHPDHAHPDRPDHDRPGHDHVCSPHPCDPHQGAPGGARQEFTGVIESIEYDSGGRWTGFRLRYCDTTRCFSGCDRALEDVIRRCCVDKSTVTVIATGKNHCQLVSLRVHCC